MKRGQTLSEIFGSSWIYPIGESPASEPMSFDDYLVGLFADIACGLGVPAVSIDLELAIDRARRAPLRITSKS